jgi:hypothetical protein
MACAMQLLVQGEHILGAGCDLLNSLSLMLTTPLLMYARK